MRWPRTAPSHEWAAGWASRMVTIAALGARGARIFSMWDLAGVPVRLVLAASSQAAWRRSGLVMARSPALGTSCWSSAKAASASGGDGALVGDGDGGAVLRGDDPVGSGDDGCRVEGAFGLVELPGGEAEPDGGACFGLHVDEGVAEEDGEFVDVGWFVAGEAVGCHADEGGVDALVLAAFGGERDAAGG